MKEIKFGTEARDKLLEGINLVSEAVVRTLGPGGKNSILSRDTAPPIVTNDGVSIASFFNKVKDPWINTGVQMIKEVATKQNEPGDGTTTATLLASSLISEGVKSLSAGIDPIIIQEGIRRASVEVIEKLKKISKPVATKDELIQVATIAVEDKESGKLIGEIMHEVGKDGAVTVEIHKGVTIEKETAQGVKFDQGFMVPYFMTNPFRQEASLGNAPILVTDHTISSNDEIVAIADKVAKNGGKMLVIICDQMKGEALATAIKNTLEDNFRFLVISLPGLDEKRTDNGSDIAAVCGANFIYQGITRMQDVEFKDLGSAEQIISKPDHTIIVRGAGKKKDLDKRIEIIKSGLKTAISDFDRDQLKERVARISGGVGVIKVGAPTEQELTYKKLKVEDALAATRAAMEEGILSGGGVALLRLIQESQDIGEQIFYRAIKQPIITIATNAGKNADSIIEKIQNNNNQYYGWDARTNQFVDMMEAGIIDPLKVTRKAIENAVSMAVTFLSTESLVVDVPEDKGDQNESSRGPGHLSRR